MIPIGLFIRWPERRLFPQSQRAAGRRMMLTMAQAIAERLRDGVFINSFSCFPSINVRKPASAGDERWFWCCSFWLCERAFRSRLTLREEGQVELLGETPNNLARVKL